MREPLVIQAGASPLAKTFENLATTLMSGPTADERALREAQARIYGAQANEMERQQEALKGAKSALAQLFEDYNPAGVPVSEIQGPLRPGESFPTEAPSQRATRISTGMADLFAQIGKDNAAALQSGLSAGQAFGAPDDMRRSMVLQGKEIGPDFAPTAGEGNRIVQRNSDIAVAEAKAKPRSKAEVEGQYLADNFDKLDQLNPYQREVLGAEPKAGTSFEVGPDGTVTYSSGGSALNLAKQNVATQQKNLQANQELKRMVGQLKEIVTTDPTVVGPVGNIQRGAQTAFDTADNLTKIFGSVEQYNADLEAARQMAARNGLSLDFNPALPNVVKLNNLLLYKAAEALAGQSGRSVTDQDIKKIKTVTGDPGSWFEGPKAYMSGLDLLSKIADDNLATTGAMLQSGSVAPIMPGAQPAGAVGGSAPAGSDPALMIQKARQAISQGKDRAMVLQRLQQMGITPPGDL